MVDKLPSASLRHELRNALAPAMMSADILLTHNDPQVQRHARMILTALDMTLKKLTPEQDSQ